MVTDLKARVLLVFALLLPAIAAFAILFRQAFSAPYEDDYHAVLSFAAGYQSLPTWKQKLLAIAAAQHNEYKLILEHSVVAAELELARHLNLYLLAILGDLALLPIAYLLWQTYQEQDIDPTYRMLKLLPVSLLFFALIEWETLDWAMAGLQNIAVVAFVLLALYLLIPRKTFAPSRTRMILACLAAALAAFTSANGFLLAPVGLLILFARRAYARALLWCVSFGIPLAAYLYHYVPVVEPRHPYFFLTRPLFFLAFLGGVVPSRWVAALLGMVVITVLGLSLRSRFDLTNPVASYFTLWILATGVLVAWVRGAQGFSMSFRYSLYPVMLWIFCYSYISHNMAARASTHRKWFYATATVAAAAFCFVADVHAYHKLAERRSMVLAGMVHYCANPALNSPSIDPLVARTIPHEPAFERSMLTESIQRGIYTDPCNERSQGR